MLHLKNHLCWDLWACLSFKLNSQHCHYSSLLNRTNWCSATYSGIHRWGPHWHIVQTFQKIQCPTCATSVKKSLETPLNACWCSRVKLMVGGLTLSVASHVIAYRLKHLWHGIAYLPSRHRHGKQCVPRRSSHTQFSLRLCLPPLAHTGTHAGRHTHE